MNKVFMKTVIVGLAFLCLGTVASAASAKTTAPQVIAQDNDNDAQLVLGATQGLYMYDTGYIGLHSSGYDLRLGLAFPNSSNQIWTIMGFGHAKLSKTENMLYGVKVMMVGGSSSGSIYSIDFGIQHQLSEKLLLEMTWAAYINAFNSSGPGLLGNVTSFYMTYIL